MVIDWQELKRWNMLVTALTLPTPEVPLVIAQGRQNLTFSWSSSFRPSSTDQSRFGYNLTMCAVHTDANLDADSECTSLELERDKDVRQTVKGDEGDAQTTSRYLKGRLREDVDAELSRRDGFEHWKYSVTVSGLRTNTQYIYRYSHISPCTKSP